MRARRNQIMALALTASVAVSTIMPSAIVYAEDYDADVEAVEVFAEEEANDDIDMILPEDEEPLPVQEEAEFEETVPEENVYFEDDLNWEELILDSEEEVVVEDVEELFAETAYADGTYSISGSGYSTNMFASDETDFPSYVVVKGEEAYLVTRSYAPNKYDAVWKGKKSEAPEDPWTANVIKGTFIADEDGSYALTGTYSGNIDEGNKAVQFVVPLTGAELEDGKVYFVLRRNIGSWMGSNDNYFDFGTLTRISDSTEVPESGQDDTVEEPEEVFGFTLQIGQYVEGTAFHKADFDGVVYSLTDEDGKSYSPSSKISGMIFYSKLDAVKTYTFTASKEGWAEVTQGAWDTDLGAYVYEFTGQDEIKRTITKDDANKNLTGLIFRKKPRQENEVDAALQLVPEDLSLYTDTSAEAVREAVNDADPEEEDEEKLAVMASNVKDAVRRLLPKDGSYSAVTEATGTGIFKIVDVISLDVKDGKMSLHFLPGSQSYPKIYVGTKEEAEQASEENHILAGEEAVTSTGKKSYHYVVPISQLETEIPIAAYSKSKSAWNSTGNFLVKANSLKKISSADPEAEKISLSIYDEEEMFKVVNAYIERKDGQDTLVFALSKTGYEDVFAGTFDEAIANGTNKDNWIHYNVATVDAVYTTKSGQQNDGTAEKYQFRIPVTLNETDTTRVPIVAISKTRATKAEAANPENPDYSEAFTARQAIIDVEEKTILIGNYKNTTEATVTSNIKSFKVQSKGTLYTVGTPTANEYTCQPTITMQDDTYDKAFRGTATEAAQAAEKDLVSVGENKSFTITFQNSLGKTPQISEGKPVTVAFHNAKKDTWIERTMTINTTAKTIVIDGEDEATQEKPEENPQNTADYTAVDAALKKIPADLSKYTDDTVKAVTAAKAAVVRNLPVSKQSQVDAMAKKIEGAVAALKKKPVAAATGTKLTQSGAGYKVLAGSKTVSYTGPTSKKVTTAKIPDTVTVGGITYKVTAIQANAFKNCKKLKSVKIGSNITTIGKNAFQNCTALKYVTIPKKVTAIGASAFAGCKSLTKVTIKSSVLKKVGKKAFSKAGSKNYKKLTVKVPKKKLKTYKSLLKKAKLSTKATVKK